MSVFSIDILKKIKDSHTQREWEAGDLINNKTGTNSGLRTFFLLYFFFKRLNHFCGQADLLIWPWSLFQHDLELTQEWPRYDLRKKPISAPMVARRMLGCPLANPMYWSKAPSKAYISSLVRRSNAYCWRNEKSLRGQWIVN